MGFVKICKKTLFTANRSQIRLPPPTPPPDLRRKLHKKLTKKINHTGEAELRTICDKNMNDNDYEQWRI